MQKKNFKVMIYQALSTIPNVDVYSSYPETTSWTYPVIVYQDESNLPDVFTIEGERMSVLRFRIEIHNGRDSNHELYLQVDEVMAGLGFRRTMNTEVRGADNNYFRTLRYDVKYDNKTNRAYHIR